MGAKNIEVVLSSEANKIYSFLEKDATVSKSSRILFNSINQKIQLIKTHYPYGDSLPKKLIPKEYKNKYNIQHLFRVELANFWRMLYVFKNNKEIEVVAFILDILDHSKYNKKFGYKNR